MTGFKTVDEVAFFLGLSRQRIYQLLAQGRIKGQKLYDGAKAPWIVTSTDEELQEFKDTPRPVGYPYKREANEE
jgi:excisionase family DNA binding protein